MPVRAISCPDIADPVLSSAIAERVAALVEAMGMILPLECLDGITIARDFTMALATLDRGKLPAVTPQATLETFGTGVAMSLRVERGGKLATHIVLDAAIGEALASEEGEAAATARFVLVHELGHVAEHALMQEAFGDVALRLFSDHYEGWLQDRVRRCWSEYYACRLTAEWAPGELGSFQALLSGSLASLEEAVDTAAPHPADGRSGVCEDGEALNVVVMISQAMAFCGQVIGHSHGCGQRADAGLTNEQKLVALGLEEWFVSLEGALERCFIAMRRDPRTDIFKPLHRLFEDAFARVCF